MDPRLRIMVSNPLMGGVYGVMSVTAFSALPSLIEIAIGRAAASGAEAGSST